MSEPGSFGLVEEEDDPLSSGPGDEGVMTEGTDITPKHDVPKVPGDTTDYAGYFTLVLNFTMAVTAVYAVISFAWVIAQLTVIGAFNYIVTYTAFVGAAYLMLMGIAVFWPSAVRSRHENVWSFLAFFTLDVAFTLAWAWLFLKRNKEFDFHHDKNHSPAPLTVAFLPYLGFNIWVIFSTIFILTLGFAVVDQKAPTAPIKLQWEGLNRRDFAGANLAMQIGGYFAIFSGMVYGTIQFFWLLSFDTGNLWGPQILYIVFMVSWVVNFVSYAYMLWYSRRPATVSKDIAPVGTLGTLTRGVNKVLRNSFLGHWEEIDRVQFFLFLFAAINLGFWIRIWTLGDVHYDERIKFGGSPETVYFSLVANAIITTIFVPLFGYNLVTFICYTQYVISTDEVLSLVQIGSKTIFSVVGIDGVAMQTINEGAEPKEESIRSGAYTALKRTMLFIFFTGIIYTLIATLIVFMDLVNEGTDPGFGHYLNARFRTWKWATLWIMVVYWFIYAAYAFVTAIRVYGEKDTIRTGYRNAMAACSFGRPLVTYGLVIFIVTLADNWVYHKHGFGAKIPHVITSDPTNPVSVLYWAVLMISFGMYIPAILAFKDILSAMLGLMYVMKEDSRTRIKALYADNKERSE